MEDTTTTDIRPNHHWNNIVHAFWFYSTITGLVVHVGMALFLYTDNVLLSFIAFVLFEILVGVVVVVHLLEILLINIRRDAPLIK